MPRHGCGRATPTRPARRPAAQRNGRPIPTLAARLQLRTSLVELLPTRDAAVVDLERTRTRMPDMHPLLIGIHSPDRAANLRYADALCSRMISAEIARYAE